MLLAVDPQGAIGRQHQRTDQYRPIGRQPDRHADHRRHPHFPRQIAQRLQRRGVRGDRQFRRQPALIAGQ
ncbi:hypothetical protein D3C81_1886350 [compost metagenome]